MPDLHPKVSGSIQVGHFESRQLTVQEHADGRWHGAVFDREESDKPLESEQLESRDDSGRASREKR